jgi:plastocyanin
VEWCWNDSEPHNATPLRAQPEGQAHKNKKKLLDLKQKYQKKSVY